MARNPRPRVRDADPAAGDPGVREVVEIFGDGSVTVSALASMLGVTRETINAHVRDRGAPIVFQGRAGVPSRINAGSYLAWRLDEQERAIMQAGGDDDDGESFDEKKEKARRAKYLADITEMDALERQGQLVTIDAASAALSEELSTVSAALSNIPGRLSTRLSTMSDPREIRGYLKREIDGVLRGMCDADELVARAVGENDAGDAGAEDGDAA
ncbi:hypothetical protein E2974_16000 [Paracoccus yeei]|uniref:hypothetical protein n=1 Tax=Paracoccus yeei TaxID=147645 RepID=UPI0037CF240E